jgi:hypothetical protein
MTFVIIKYESENKTEWKTDRTLKYPSGAQRIKC